MHYDIQDDLDHEAEWSMRAAVDEYAREYGAIFSSAAWISSPYDTWERNPHYVGPEQPHPEDDCWNDPDFDPTSPPPPARKNTSYDVRWGCVAASDEIPF
jgi:hypothetical protein